MSENPQHTRLRFGTRQLLILTAAIAAGTAFISYKSGPFFAATTSLVCITAMVIVGGACLLPERYGKWLRPLAVIISGILAIGVGMWVRKNF
jgi:putative Mn2+ efflux pump MntP